jgi:thiol-disulfide isomerase/thioredoxin
MPRPAAWTLAVGLAALAGCAAKPLGQPTADAAPELDGGTAWLNTAKPVTLKELKGKVVLLDFWTLCCINCIHVMPDLAKLEAKYPDQLVVIGVHSPKFDSEKDTASIKKAVLRYELAHPVVNDADRKIWDAYGVNSWPTLVLIDPEGRPVGKVSGEGNYEVLDRVIGQLVQKHRASKTLDETPRRFELLRDKTPEGPLAFPGKLLADAATNSLYIADSTHHRVVATDLGGTQKRVIGAGRPGYKDGSFAEAEFNDPQGLVLDGDTLYIADRKNHCLRAADLKAGTVTTVAGTGSQAGGFELRQADAPLPARTTGLNSPWDILKVGRTLFIAMAGHHQIWAMDLDAKTVRPFAGNGRENIRDGSLAGAEFAQPSGLTTDGTFLYVADSETSSVRKLPLSGDGRVETLAGRGLFEFGDADGAYPSSRLQHALAVLWHDGGLIVADTYNSKLKRLDPKTKTLTTWVGKEFDEPAGLSIANGKLYVADTNANRIRVVDLGTKAVTTLELKGVIPPATAAKK